MNDINDVAITAVELGQPCLAGCLPENGAAVAFDFDAFTAGEAMRQAGGTVALCLNHELGNVALDLRVISTNFYGRLADQAQWANAFGITLDYRFGQTERGDAESFRLNASGGLSRGAFSAVWSG